ncbi:arginase family protein [Grosmannia clavigera kw1407]|uniref:Arginase family protein n=1 Tax=Grosmannia clavigera (strain kw1407 / UAMH 11150) TaxID=655863 RepID=F0XE29_GROCL|nr:arginase family protein [Grosmannia clavigera kw1407]EFX04360.1 arginase family protein [Grosmannia clavigera kw1407]
MSKFLLLLVAVSQAREIVFPPVAAIRGPAAHTQFHLTSDVDLDDDVDLTTDPVGGLASFAHLPYVPCFSSKTDDEVEKYDIAVLGAPFDTATSYRPGARFGPHGIRDGSRRIRPNHSWNIYSGHNRLKEWAKLVDCGNAPLTVVDNTMALKQLVKAHKITSGRVANNASIATIPRVMMLGGDHTITLAALRSTYEYWGVVSVIHFDSHIDTWDPTASGGGITDYASVNHGTFLHIAHEEGLISNDSSIHAGIRAPLGTQHRDLNNDVQCGFDIVTARDIDALGTQGVIDKLKNRVGDSKVYITVDIDVLDPAYAPATGTAEPGGWTTRELLTILDGLIGLKVIGADVVEVAPAYDNTGETTCLAAAEVARSLIGLMVAVPVTNKD